MACCGLKRRKDKNYVIKLAKLHSRVHKVNVQVFHETKIGFGKVYDYEEVKKGRSLIDEVIKFQPDKSENVLQNPGRGGEKPAESKKFKDK